jgi:triosephosphate isomerase
VTFLCSGEFFIGERLFSATGETDAVVAAKVDQALGAGVNVIACIGETAAEREAGRTFEVLERQLGSIIEALAGALEDMEEDEEVEGFGVAEVVIAYEPVWAIGSGKAATPAQAQEVRVCDACLHPGFFRVYKLLSAGAAVAC